MVSKLESWAPWMSLPLTCPAQQHPNENRALIVSIHDVSPITWPTVVSMRAELREIGVKHLSLLVIPNHHHRGHFLDDEAFCSWLSGQTEDEIVIHGYYHQRERKESERLASKLITRIYTSGEGEFYDIGREEALQAVSLAQEEFGRLGLHPTGFIAPAWLLSEPAADALKTLGCAYTTTLRTVVDCPGGRTAHSQSLVYSARNGWRRMASLAWNAFLHRRLRHNPLLRIGIHPPDFSHPAIWRQVTRLIALSLRERTAMTYQEWIGARLKNPEQ